MTAWYILIAACALIVHQIWRDRRTFPAFEALEESHLRRKAFANWTVDSFFRYGVAGLIGLWLLDAMEAFWDDAERSTCSNCGQRVERPGPYVMPEHLKS